MRGLFICTDNTNGMATESSYQEPEETGHSTVFDDSLLVKQDDIDKLGEFIEALLEVDIDSPYATINETSISDNNGSRIEL